MPLNGVGNHIEGQLCDKISQGLLSLFAYCKSLTVTVEGEGGITNSLFENICTITD